MRAAQIASRAAGCGYCMPRTTHTAGRVAISAEKEDALCDYERSPLFSDSERAPLRVAQGAAQVPNAVTDADFAELKRHYTDAQIVDIVVVIWLFGFLNRFNDTMATELEALPLETGERFSPRRVGRLASMRGKVGTSLPLPRTLRGSR
jgi:alkylhydroperoxidase family enzyme